MTCIRIMHLLLDIVFFFVLGKEDSHSEIRVCVHPPMELFSLLQLLAEHEIFTRNDSQLLAVNDFFDLVTVIIFFGIINWKLDMSCEPVILILVPFRRQRLLRGVLEDLRLPPGRREDPNFLSGSLGKEGLRDRPHGVDEGRNIHENKVLDQLDVVFGHEFRQGSESSGDESVKTFVVL